MDWINLFALVLGGLAVIPILVIARSIASRSRYRQMPEAPQAAEEPGVFALAGEDEAYQAPEPQAAAHGKLRTFMLRDASTSTSGLRVRTGGFEYTIRPQNGSLPQRAPNLGGFTKIPLLLYDKLGNCVMVHRRVSLN